MLSSCLGTPIRGQGRGTPDEHHPHHRHSHHSTGWRWILGIWPVWQCWARGYPRACADNRTYLVPTRASARLGGQYAIHGPVLGAPRIERRWRFLVLEGSAFLAWTWCYPRVDRSARVEGLPSGLR